MTELTRAWARRTTPPNRHRALSTCDGAGSPAQLFHRLNGHPLQGPCRIPPRRPPESQLGSPAAGAGVLPLAPAPALDRTEGVRSVGPWNSFTTTSNSSSSSKCRNSVSGFGSPSANDLEVELVLNLAVQDLQLPISDLSGRNSSCPAKKQPTASPCSG